MAVAKRCETCKYYGPVGKGLGLCRGVLPAAGADPVFPVVEGKKDWCAYWTREIPDTLDLKEHIL